MMVYAGDLKVKHDKRVTVEDDKLVLHNIEPKNSGFYTCELEKGNGDLKSFTTSLIVLIPALARIDQVGSQLTVKAGMYSKVLYQVKKNKC